MTMQKDYYRGTGRRKSAVAQVRVYPGSEQVAINGRTLEEALPWPSWRAHALEPLRATEMSNQFAVVARVHGGGISGWAGALRHGVARALLDYNPDFRAVLRQNGMLTRDSRVKESKKYGLKRARRAPQYTKR